MGNPISKYGKLLSKIIESRLDGRSGSWLSRVSGISQSKISRILSYQAEPDLSELFEVVKALQLPIDLVVSSVFYGDFSDSQIEAMFSGKLVYPGDERHHRSVLTQLKNVLNESRGFTPRTVGDMSVEQLKALLREAHAGMSTEELELITLFNRADDGRRDTILRHARTLVGNDGEVRSIPKKGD